MWIPEERENFCPGESEPEARKGTHSRVTGLKPVAMFVGLPFKVSRDGLSDHGPPISLATTGIAREITATWSTLCIARTSQDLFVLVRSTASCICSRQLLRHISADLK